MRSWLWSKKWYVLLTTIALVAISVLAIKLVATNKQLANLRREIINTAEVTKENDHIYSQYLATTDFLGSLVPAEIAHIVDKRHESAIIANHSQLQVQSTHETVPLVNSQDFAYADGFVDLAGTVRLDNVELQLTYQPIAVDLVVSERDGVYHAYLDTNNPNISVVANHIAVDKTFAAKQKRHLVGGLVGYRPSDTNSWSNIIVGGQYVYLFDSIGLGGQVQVGLDGEIDLAVIIGGRF